MILVRLSREDEIVAASAGLARESRYGSNPKFQGNKGNFHNAVTIHSEAVGAEIAVARYFGLEDFVPTVNTFKNEPDINLHGVSLEVKQTSHKRGHLIITDDDRDTDIAVLVCGEEYVRCGVNADGAQHLQLAQALQPVQTEPVRSLRYVQEGG